MSKHIWILKAIALGTASGFINANAGAQVVPRIDSAMTVTVRVQRDSVSPPEPLASAVVRANAQNTRTNTRGEAMLRLTTGMHTIVVTKLGYRPDSVLLSVQFNRDTAVVVSLVQQPATVDAVMVTSTRSERRVEDTPIRVEVIDDEEMAEKVAMAPGDIAMMLNETSGLRVQPTNPSLGGANVRIQGLRGRYSLLLADGLPLYGGQAGGLGLLQIPPVDLGRVEIIKGTASALYGSSALGGVIDLISRRPSEEAERTLLVNQTSRNGTDAVAYLSGPLGGAAGGTLLVSGNRQSRADIDGDGWTDIPGYERAVVRPRLYFDNHNGRTAFVTAGLTAEDRNGGTLAGRVTPAGTAYDESLRTRRADAGALAQWRMNDGGDASGTVFTLRASGVEQRHTHQFGNVTEKDRHRTWFGEASLAVPRGAFSYVLGAAFQQESFRAENVAGFDYTYNIPAVFAQVDIDARQWLSLSTSVRADKHNTYGAFVNPRLSVLVRAPGQLAGWTARLSGGTGAFAPTPFVEETEVTGLTPLEPPVGLSAERAQSGSIDLGGPIHLTAGEVEVNITAFGSLVNHALQTTAAQTVTAGGARKLLLLNSLGPTRTWGGELLARITHPFGDDEAPKLRLTGTYTLLRSTECTAVDPTMLQLQAGCGRHEVALTPKHSLGLVTTVEQEGVSRVGLELYYTGRQQLENNPYRTESKPYLIVGLMGERAFTTRVGTFRAFLNFENITDVRQSRYDRLLLPARGIGGRWTTDAWTDLNGFTTNGGVRFVW